jgi:hypothetical protein
VTVFVAFPCKLHVVSFPVLLRIRFLSFLRLRHAR